MRLFVLFLVFAAFAGCQSRPQMTLVDVHSEERTSTPAMGQFGISGFILHFKNTSHQTIRSMRITTAVDIPEPYHGPGSIAPAGWTAPVYHATHRFYANVDLPPGKDVFLAADEPWLCRRTALTSIEADTVAFNPNVSSAAISPTTGYLYLSTDDGWRTLTPVTDATPSTLHAFIVRNDPKDEISKVSPDVMYKWNSFPLMPAK